MSRIPRKRPLWAAVVLNVFLPGLGHMFFDRVGRGLIWLAGAMVVAGLSLNAPSSKNAFLGIQLALAVASAIDVWMISRAQPGERF